MATSLKEKKKSKRMRQDDFVGRTEHRTTMSEFLVELIGLPVFVICVRYSYRGILSRVADDCIILTNSAAVEQMGSASQDKPAQEDNIGSWVMIALDAIEICFQPNCVNAPLPGEAEE